MDIDFLASAPNQQSMPVWLIVLIGLGSGMLVDRIPQLRAAKEWQRWLFVGLAGGVAGAIAWCVGYFFFNVDLSA